MPLYSMYISSIYKYIGMRFLSLSSLRWLPAVSIATLTITALTTTGCRLAPKDDPVAASEFTPVDTSSAAYKARHKKILAAGKDSTDIFYIGEGSNRRTLRLISYPSKKDTIEMKRKRHIDVYGRTDAGHIVKVIWEVTAQGDTVVTQLMELNPKK